MVFRIFKREIYKNLLHRPTIMLVLGAIIIALMINGIGGIYSKTEINRRYSQYPATMVAAAVGIDVSEFDSETEIENVILKRKRQT